jgi:hypothetical protein
VPDVLPGRRLDYRNRNRPLDGAAAAGSLDRESKVAEGVKRVIKHPERFLPKVEMTSVSKRSKFVISSEARNLS